jgi:ATP-dependent DNA helicase PIF1
VERSNERRLSGLSGVAHSYVAQDSGTAEPETRVKLLSNMMAPHRLQLKIDTQVMLIKNVDETLVNGSVGRVLGFYDQQTWTNMQMGVGMNEEDDTKDSKDPKGKKKPAAAGQPLFPLVRFVVPGGTRDVLVVSETWKVELPSGEVQAARQQVSMRIGKEKPGRKID